MSRVYFHTPRGEAELWGGEKAWLGVLCDEIARGLLNPQGNHERVHEIMPDSPGWGAMPKYPCPDYYPKFMQWCQSANAALGLMCDESRFVWRGQRFDAWHLSLNTAAKVGSDAVKLAARIHGQCEIHCYVEGVDRAWVAGLIDQGLETGVFRRSLPPKAPCWDGVTKLLRDRDDEPVVLSYSVCDSFPNEEAAGWEDGSEAWYGLSDEERWRLAMDGLRNRGGGLRLQPADWSTFYFGHGLTVLDLLAFDYADRLDLALGLTETAECGNGTNDRP